MVQGFEKLVQVDVVTKKSAETLKECLDNWTTKPTKSKRKKIKDKEINKDVEVKKENCSAEVEILGEKYTNL